MLTLPGDAWGDPGGRNIVPKKKGALDTAKEMERLSKVINAKNEENSAAKATNAADKLNIVSIRRPSARQTHHASLKALPCYGIYSC